jgi:hypothetical protein
MLPFALAGILFSSFWFRAEAPRIVAGVNDFMGIYAGARLVGTPAQFNAEAYIREQERATGWSAPSILFTRLPAFAALLRPLGKLPYRRAYILWQTASLAAFAGFLIFWPTLHRALLLCAACWSFPLFACFAGGQDISFLLLILAVAWRLGPSRPFAAGAMLALCALKFHLFLVLPVFLIAQLRWRMLAGATVAGSAIAAMCFAVAGAGWLPDYAHFILQGQTNPNVRAMPNLHGLLDGLPHSLAWEIGGVILVAVAVAWIARHASFSVGLSAALAGSLLASHHAYPADALLLLPALLTLAGSPRIPVRAISILLLSPLPFLVAPMVPLAAPAPLLLAALLLVLAVTVTAPPHPRPAPFAAAAS